MPDLKGRAKRFAASWRADALLAVLVVTWAVASLAAGPERDWVALVFVVPYAAALAVRRRWPLAAAVVTCGLWLTVRPLGLAAALGGHLGVPFLWATFFLTYALGTGTGFFTGLAATVALAACLELAIQPFNPIGVVLAVGPWLAGRVVQSRHRMTEQLRARNEELQAERELFAQESVRYERARIARELHDIVAHCLSVMVVQASAGQRAAPADRAGVARALESVAEAAAQAQTEIGRLVELLSGKLPSGTAPRLEMAGELVRRASLTGLAVSCRYLGHHDQLSPAASEAAYRLVQEALTNALKHAPGAPVEITIHGRGATVEVSITNAAPPGQRSGLERSGAGYGLSAMRDRITACGGTLSCGPTAAGGWRVSALLPAAPLEVTRPGQDLGPGYRCLRVLTPHVGFPAHPSAVAAGSWVPWLAGWMRLAATSRPGAAPPLVRHRPAAVVVLCSPRLATTCAARSTTCS
jgi:signal transduction histidine kinase